MTKRIVLTGGTGFIGKQLTLALLKKGYDVTILTRNPDQFKCPELPVTYVKWDPVTQPPDTSVLEGAHAVIHLAGEPVAAKRWSPKQKLAIYESRVLGTRHLVEAIRQTKMPPKALISTSAIGFYSDRRDEILDEDSLPGTSFLARVCKDWESEIKGLSCRVVIIRVGLVLSALDGALSTMLPAFRLGLGASLGSGKQKMSWIHYKDLIQMYVFSLEQETVSGVLNGVAPNPVTNRVFSKKIGHYLGRPVWMSIPSFVVSLLFGEMADIVLASQWVCPKRPMLEGFTYEFPTIDVALSELLAPKGYNNAYRLEAHQWFDKSGEEVFVFFSDATNLERITPPWLNFKIVKMSGELASGTRIDYALNVRGLPLRWRTVIELWQPISVFSDKMEKGPYKTWDHTHYFEPLKQGTLMTDVVIYRLPFGILGDIAALLWVKRDVQSIFKFRKAALSRFF